MELDVRTLYVMYAVLYLMMHGIIWFSLSRYQSRFVRSWSTAGIVSALGIALLACQGVLPDWVVATCGQVFMAAGNLGRQYVLRSLGEPPTTRWVWGHGFFHLAYLGVNGALFISGASHRDMMLVFFLFYALSCLEFFFSGKKIGRYRNTSGAVSVQFGGLVFTASLGIKAISLLIGWGAQGLYDPGWDQVLLFAAQILAVGLLNFGFMQILVDQFQQQKARTEHDLLLQRERTAQAEQQSLDLKQVLREREEIIRQLTLSNKTAGMDALVSSIAHEMNQPLTTVVLKTELVESYLADPKGADEIRRLCSLIREDAHRAGAMIRTLRSLFVRGAGGFEVFDFAGMLRNVTDIIRSRTRGLGIDLVVNLPGALRLIGEATQLQQVVLNLLNNAIQAVSQPAVTDACICVDCRLQGDWVELRVQDNGQGIDPALRPDVFSLFKSPASHGMGVGLWLSQAVVQSHGGTLDFESAPGQGAVFLLRLPVRDPVPVR